MQIAVFMRGRLSGLKTVRAALWMKASLRQRVLLYRAGHV